MVSAVGPAWTGHAWADSGVSVYEAAGSVSFTTAKTFGRAHLVVSGPNDFTIDRTFIDGETPGFSIHDGFDAAEDGSYGWSLTVTSLIDDGLKEQMAAARAGGDDRFMDRHPASP